MFTKANIKSHNDDQEFCPWAWSNSDISDDELIFKLKPVEHTVPSPISLDISKGQTAALNVLVSSLAQEKPEFFQHPIFNRLYNGSSYDVFQYIHCLTFLWPEISPDQKELITNKNIQLTVKESINLWSTDGLIPLDKGTYWLNSFLELISLSHNKTNNLIPLDVFWSTILPIHKPVQASSDDFDLPIEWSLSHSQERSEETLEELKKDIRNFWYTQTIIEQKLPNIMRWLRGNLSLCFPIVKAQDRRVKSSSNVRIPGGVFLQLNTPTHIIGESLVHETAHLYLYREERLSPLVQPGHKGVYQSELRPEPRPLRGILMAYHALAYMCAYYADCLNNSIFGNVEKEYEVLLAKLQDSEKTMLSAKQYLTPAGREFFKQTQLVHSYGGL